MPISLMDAIFGGAKIAGGVAATALTGGAAAPLAVAGGAATAVDLANKANTPAAAPPPPPQAVTPQPPLPQGPNPMSETAPGQQWTSGGDPYGVNKQPQMMPAMSDRTNKVNVQSAERSIKDFLNQVYGHAH